MSKNGWTLERRKRQAELIRNWKPWEKSTGAKTPEGKAIVAKNPIQHGAYSAERKALMRALRQQYRTLAEVQEFMGE